MNSVNQSQTPPVDGLLALSRYWKSDMISGFLVFLLALPLSLGIAKASDFPPIMGLITAIVGGVIVSFFAGSLLTIKGPAAGLIVIVAGAVHEFGEGIIGWQMALATIVVAGFIQVLFGVFKLGSLSDFFPSSVVHGMLAAIGLIIFSKQIHTLLGIDPSQLKGLETFELFEKIPHSILNLNPAIALVGIVSIAIVFGLPLLKNKFIKLVPSPLLVLLVAIPLGLYLDFAHNQPTYALVKLGSFIDNIAINVSFEGLSKPFLFAKYVIMFALVGTIESLLTVKATDPMDRFKRKSNYNKDLIAVGIGNMIAGLLGGLPMISEVARSSANINNGATSRWANFFHGLFLLISVIALVPLLEMIPNAALAAMLIGVGYRLAAPKEFYKTYKIGPEQLIIFIATVIATLATDLLLGVVVGILVKFITHIVYGVPIRALFKADAILTDNKNNQYQLKISSAAIFSNYLSLKKYIQQVPPSAILTVDLSDCIVVDHTFMEHLHTIENNMQNQDGQLNIVGLEYHKHLSAHPLGLRRKVLGNMHKTVSQELVLNPRQKLLLKYAQQNNYQFNPQFTLSTTKLRKFGFAGLHKIKGEENILSGSIHQHHFELSDITIEEVQRLTKYDYKMTILIFNQTNFSIPDFSIEEEGIFDKIIGKEDIDFDQYPHFSQRYIVHGNDVAAVRNFFTPTIIDFFESNPGFYLDVVGGKLFFYGEPSLLNVEQCHRILNFASGFIKML
jgi:MFS superfamily sulfate permease-like transporter